MAEETIITAARRLVRFIRIDDEREGGLLSRETIMANETLDRELRKEQAPFAAAYLLAGRLAGRVPPDVEGDLAELLDHLAAQT